MGTSSNFLSIIEEVLEYAQEFFMEFLQVYRTCEKDCCAFGLMRGWPTDTYKIQEENVIEEGWVPQYNNPRGFNQGVWGGFKRGRGW